MTATTQSQISKTQGLHRKFLNQYYGATRNIYDLTRKYYLLGRDKALEMILEKPWNTIAEVGAGTGRNLAILKKSKPNATYIGVEPCDAMREYMDEHHSFIETVNCFAENFEPEALGLAKPDIILFSYALSMIEEPEKALEGAKNALAPGGKIFVVDFGNLEKLPIPAKFALRKWLHTFHTHPERVDFLYKEKHAKLTHGIGNYWMVGELEP